MQVYLIRHTEPECDAGICYGQTNLGLKKTYASDFKRIKEQLPLEEIQTYTSPLQRCLDLAKYLAGDKFEIDFRLLELDFGKWEMKKWDEIPSNELDPWMKDFVNVQVPEGESFVELHKRVEDFIHALKKKKKEKVLIITHAGVIRSFLCYVQEKPLQEAFKNKINFGDIIKITL